MPKKKGHHAFIIGGFCNCKKAKMSFKKHERGQMHKEACLKLHALHQPSVTAQLSKELETENVLTSLKLLTRQRLPICGHTDEESYLVQLLECRAEDAEGFQTWVNSGRYLLHEIMNEIIELMAHHILRNLIADIKMAKWFSIIADETQDISGHE